MLAGCYQTLSSPFMNTSIKQSPSDISPSLALTSMERPAPTKENVKDIVIVLPDSLAVNLGGYDIDFNARLQGGQRDTCHPR